MLMVIKKENTFDKIFNKISGKFKEFKSRFSFIKINGLDYMMAFYTIKWGYICFHLPSKNLGWFYYLSPDAKVDSSTFYRGFDKGEKLRAMLRKEILSHNWIYKYSNSTHVPRSELERIKDYVSCLNEDMLTVYKSYGIFGYSSESEEGYYMEK